MSNFARAITARWAFAGLAMVLFNARAAAQADFRRGDANVDGVVDVADGYFGLAYTYFGGATPACQDAADANADGSLNISDSFAIINFLFQGGFSPPAPGPEVPGPDPDPDDEQLTCASYDPSRPDPVAQVSIGFDCPPVSGAPGETVQFEVFATITTSSNTVSRGPVAWSLSIGAEEIRILSVTTEGTVAASSIIFPPSERVDPEIEAGGEPQGEGAISGGLLVAGGPAPIEVPREGTLKVLRIGVEATRPEQGPSRARLFFVDGKIGRGGRPVPNLVVIDGIPQVPERVDCEISIGDCDRNGIPDIEELAAGASPDCNRNLFPDSCDTAAGKSPDADGDGIPDECAGAVVLWSESFDAYTSGQGIIGKGGWEGWAGDRTVDARVRSDRAFSSPNSLATSSNTDVVQRFAIGPELWTGRWVFRAKVFVPSNHRGTTWLNLLNQYQPNVSAFNWSAQITFGEGKVRSHGGTNFFSRLGTGVPVAPDVWAELRVEIDLEENRQTVYYQGELLHETAWHHDSLSEIQALDIFSEAGSTVWFDDLVLASRPLDPDCDRNGVPDPVELSDNLSFASTSFLAETNPVSVVGRDLDGDGDQDLAVANRGASTVSVHLNAGGGAFAPRHTYPVGAEPAGITAADLDGANGPDLVTANRTALNVSVLRNNGPGMFAAAEHVPLPGAPSGLEPGDFNGDGDVDLAVVGSPNKLWILENRDGGTLHLGGTFSTLAPGNRVAGADLERDGDLDLVTANQHVVNSLSVLRNKGDGTFEAAVALGIGEAVLSLALQDLDGDGGEDIAGAGGGNPTLGDPSSSTLFVLRNDGRGSFGPPEVFPVGSIVEAIAAGDLDGDASVDLTAAGANRNVWILRNSGERGFERAFPLIAGDGPSAIAVGELSGDRRLDLAVANIRSGDVSVFINTTDGTRIDCNRNGIPDSCDLEVGTSLDANGDGVPDECGGLQLPGDCSQDGRTDISDAICLLGHLFLGSPGVLPCEGSTAAAPGPGDLALINFNGDGRIDLSDAIGLLGWLFLGNFPPHVLGEECINIAGCPDNSAECNP